VVDLAALHAIGDGVLGRNSAAQELLARGLRGEQLAAATGVARHRCRVRVGRRAGGRVIEGAVGGPGVGDPTVYGAGRVGVLLTVLSRTDHNARGNGEVVGLVGRRAVVVGDRARPGELVAVVVDDVVVGRRLAGTD